MTLIVLFLIYFGLEALFYFFGPGHNVKYLVDNYDIKESFTNNQKDELSNYYFEISKDDFRIDLQIFDNFENEEKIITEIKSINDSNVQCILPIFKDSRILTDLLCLKDDVVYDYKTILGNNSTIDEFYSNLELNNKEDLSDKDTLSNITLFKNNMPENYYLSFVTYKGYYYANGTNKTLKAKNIFDFDAYDNYLSAYIDKYYVTVNYDEKYGYNYIYIFNILNSNEEKITLAKAIEKNSYIQGKKDNSIYIFDRSNKKQYEVNVLTKTVLEVGNSEIGVKVYLDGEWSYKTAYECSLNDIYFTEKVNLEEYVLFSKTIGSKTGYSYFYKKAGYIYDIYRANNQNIEQKKYLFSTKYIDKVITLNDYIFYLADYYIKYYSDKTDIRTLVENKELYFNQSLEYQIYYQK